MRQKKITKSNKNEENKMDEYLKELEEAEQQSKQEKKEFLKENYEKSYELEKREKRVLNLIIVDESGSMEVIRKQAFSGMNETLQTVRKLEEQLTDTAQLVTLVTFDSGHFTTHFDNTYAFYTKDLQWDAYNPGGCTPLYDAMGKAVSKLYAQTREDDNVIVTVITDGEENSSREWNLSMIKELIEKLKRQNWTFNLIGTDNLDVERIAHHFSIDNTLSFKQDAEGTGKMFSVFEDSIIQFCYELHEDRKPKKNFFSRD